MNRLLPFLGLVLALPLTAAETPATPATTAPAPAVAAAATTVTNALAPAPASTNSTVATATGTNAPAKEGLSTTVVDPATRELKPHDVMRLTIAEDPPLPNGSDLNRVAVSVGGEALFPVSRHSDIYVKVKAAGRKLEDIRKDLKVLLDADYYNDATVTLDLEGISVSPGGVGNDLAKVTIYGSLNQMVPIAEGETLMLSEAILRAGGGVKGGFANLSKVLIHRLDPGTKKEITLTVNVEKVLYKGARDEDKPLMNGDRIEVKDKSFNFFNN